MAKGLFGIFSIFSVSAFGCLAPSRNGGAEITAEGAEPLNWVGCPNDVVASTANYAPPHAFPGCCQGPASEQQAGWDGALDEMGSDCVTYCGQSEAACGAGAHIEQLHCIDRDIGHRWGGICICSPAGPGGPGPGPGGPGPGPGPGGPGPGPGPGGPGPGGPGPGGPGFGPGPGGPGFGPGPGGPGFGHGPGGPGGPASYDQPPWP